MQQQLRTLVWPEWRAHPWRLLLALLAIALGVALAFSVQLINGSALDEFGSAVRAVDGKPDLAVRAQGPNFGGSGFDEAIYARLAADPQVALASPVVEGELAALDARGERVPLRVVGIDALLVAAIAPDLVPRPAADADRLALVNPGLGFLNATARQRLGSTGTLRFIGLQGERSLPLAGEVTAAGPPLLVMDIAGAQALLGSVGRLQRIDLRLQRGVAPADWLRRAALPPGLRSASPADAPSRIAQLSRAYRVNLTVLALVALFTGAFLVFSVMALSVARRIPQLALLGVLGLSARERLRLVLAEGALLGLIGALLGIALGTALAALALRWLGGDLGGGYFQGLAPRLHWSPLAAAVYGALGIAAAVVGSWMPARQAQRMAPAQALKGLGLEAARGLPAWTGPLLMLLAVGLALLPPIAELPIGAYLSVAVGLVGGMLFVPAAVQALLWAWPQPRRALPLLALQRARDQRAQASVAVAGVVASLSLGVALTVMVGSFRDAVSDWLQQLLPAELYLRSAASVGAAEAVALPPTLLQAAAAVPGVQRVNGQRTRQLTLDPARPAVLLLARPLPARGGRGLPLVGEQLPAPPGALTAHVSEAMAALYGARPGTLLKLPLPAGEREVFVRGVWRDYARQHGAVLMDIADYRAATGDTSLTDLALWLTPGADAVAVQAALRRASPVPLELATTAELRAFSLRLFDRSFAVTTYLQAVAIAIGLFGVAASFSAQVLARRKEFGVLAHLGVTRRELLALVAAEGALWTGAGALLGLLLGLAVSVVLVKVVNPQSFHWTMDLSVPWARLGLLCAAVLAAGTLTAGLAGRGAAGREMALAVKEDW